MEKKVETGTDGGIGGKVRVGGDAAREGGIGAEGS
jgi:hypothetical protein